MKRFLPLLFCLAALTVFADTITITVIDPNPPAANVTGYYLRWTNSLGTNVVFSASKTITFQNSQSVFPTNAITRFSLTATNAAGESDPGIWYWPVPQPPYATLEYIPSRPTSVTRRP